MIVTSTTGCSLIARRLVDRGSSDRPTPARGARGHHARRRTPGGAHRCTSPKQLIIAIAVLLVGSIAASFVDRLGAPTLLVFLGLGMLLGEDGPGGIHFDDATLARDAGTVALMIILIEGGLLAERSEVRRALAPAGLLATLGVLATAGGGRALGARRRRPRLDALAAARRRRLVDRRRGRVRLAARHGRAPQPGRDPRGRERSQRPVRGAARDRPRRMEHDERFGTGDGALLLVRQAGIGAAGGLAVGVAGRVAAAPPAAALGRAHARDHGRRSRWPAPSASPRWTARACSRPTSSAS